MIKYVKGDATNPNGDGTKIIVHCVNDMGYWGKGFVLALSKKWKKAEESYREWSRKGSIFRLGAIQLVNVENDIVVVHLVGQHDIYAKNNVPPVRYDALRKGLQELYWHVNKPDNSIHMPRICCGLAGGDWNIVEQIINEELANKGIDVTVYDLPDQGLLTYNKG